MPFIPPQVKPAERLTITCKVPTETATLLKRYAEFLDSAKDYVVNEILLLAFRRDREFQDWLATTSPHDGNGSVPATQQAERSRS